jgi:tryptophanyl-tRNA synthetase
MSKSVILTGLRANNDLTIGNYFGAILPMIDMATTKAHEYQINMFVPDLHSFTTPIDHRALQEGVMQNLRVFAAAGLPLDNDDIHIYRQSYIPAHSELTWILDCFTGMGEMSRMTQFKDKSLKLAGQGGMIDSIFDNDGEQMSYNRYKHDAQRNRISVGLFNYPVLMAADILLYGADYVPVGEDQTQHLEFTRDIAERMNRQFETEFADGLFTIPKSVKEQHTFFGKDQGLRIKDLVDPTKKMSKSDETGKGVIFLSDTPEAAGKKIMGATTDSLANIKYDKANQPGIANLLDILALLSGRPLQEAIADWEGKERYGDLKTAVAESVKQFLTVFQQNLSEINDQDILAKLEQSEATMREQAGATLLRAQQAVGLRSFS